MGTVTAIPVSAAEFFAAPSGSARYVDAARVVGDDVLSTLPPDSTHSLITAPNARTSRSRARLGYGTNDTRKAADAHPGFACQFFFPATTTCVGRSVGRSVRLRPVFRGFSATAIDESVVGDRVECARNFPGSSSRASVGRSVGVMSPTVAVRQIFFFFGCRRLAAAHTLSRPRSQRSFTSLRGARCRPLSRTLLPRVSVRVDRQLRSPHTSVCTERPRRVQVAVHRPTTLHSRESAGAMRESSSRGIGGGGNGAARHRRCSSHAAKRGPARSSSAGSLGSGRVGRVTHLSRGSPRILSRPRSPPRSRRPSHRVPGGRPTAFPAAVPPRSPHERRRCPRRDLGKFCRDLGLWLPQAFPGAVSATTASLPWGRQLDHREPSRRRQLDHREPSRRRQLYHREQSRRYRLALRTFPVTVSATTAIIAVAP